MLEKIIQRTIIVVFLIMVAVFIIGPKVVDTREYDPYDVTCEFKYTSSGRFGLHHGVKKVPCRLTSDHIPSEE